MQLVSQDPFDFADYLLTVVVIQLIGMSWIIHMNRQLISIKRKLNQRLPIIKPINLQDIFHSLIIVCYVIGVW